MEISKFAPVIYEHAARVIGKTPWEVSRDKNLLAQAHAEAYRIYRHTPIVVGIDIYNLEAEAYGAVVDPPQGTGIPTIRQPFFSSAKEIADVPLFEPEKDGRISDVIEAALEIKNIFREADVRIPVSGPFSIASQLLGMENLLMESIMNPDNVSVALERLIEGQEIFARYIRANDLDISFFESSATPPLISPQIFSDVVLPGLKKMVQTAEEIFGHPVACIMGGDTAPIIDLIMTIGAGYVICPYETDQKNFMEKMKKYSDTLVRINMNPEVLVRHSDEDVFREVDRVLELAKIRENVVIGSGIVPYEAEPEILLKVRDYVEENI
ncbi:MAG: hypothetical protein GXO74_03415 [Calditrichaeota bacterium]|nr:hypothetical protein [Calditrichota bacterium]